MLIALTGFKQRHNPHRLPVFDAEKCAARVRRLSPNFDQDTFFRNFGFLNVETRAMAGAALRRLGI